MKKITYIFAIFAVAGLVSCNKMESSSDNFVSGNVEMAFGVKGEGINVEVATKAITPVTSVESVYWSATSGTVGSDTEVYAPMTVALNNSKFSTGKYWPSESIAYNYYVSNKVFTWDGSNHAASIAAVNTEDIVAGTASAAYKSTPEVTVDHIFARTGSLTLVAQDEYELVGNATWKIKSNTGAGTAGTYNIGAKTWSGATALAQQVFTSDSDLYLLPGSYHIEITYTLKKGDFQKEFTKGADVTFDAGKTNNIKATAHVGTEGAEEIIFTVTVTPWDSKDITISEGDLK